MITLTKTLFSLLITAGVTLAAEQKDVVKEFQGVGRIHVLNSSSLRDASLAADRIGCLNEQGLLTQDDCAVFYIRNTTHHTLSSRRGDCSFQNANMPVNKDSVYGKTSHAWSCGGRVGTRPSAGGSDYDGAPLENYYTINGFSYPFVCNGNLNCYYDIPREPTRDETVQPVWQYYWGGQQMGITPGHMQVLWLWVPLKKGDSEGNEN